MHYCHVSPRVGRGFDHCAAVSAHELHRAALLCRYTVCNSQLVQVSTARSLLAFVLWRSRKIAVADDSIADQVTSQPVNSSFDSGSAMARSWLEVSDMSSTSFVMTAEDAIGRSKRITPPMRDPFPGSNLLMPFG